jgi:NADPH2:quinone reductase
VIAETGAERRSLPSSRCPSRARARLRIRVAACGLNFADLLMIDGRYQERPTPPFTPGHRNRRHRRRAGAGGGRPGAGHPGRGVSRVGRAGRAGLPAGRTLRADLPEAMPMTAAAAFQVAYGTAHVALAHRAALRPGETLLVTGAAGGVGLTGVETGPADGRPGDRGGARRRPAGDRPRRPGAEVLIDTGTEDLRAAVKAAGGADVVYDAVGGELFDAALRAANPEARLIPIGFASGQVPQIPANLLLVKNLTVIGLYWGGYLRFRPEVLTGSLRTLLDWYAAGRLHPPVGDVLPLERTAEALALLRDRRARGKVVVTLGYTDGH